LGVFSVETPAVFAVLLEAAKAKFLLCNSRVCLAKNAERFYEFGFAEFGVARDHNPVLRGGPLSAFLGSFLSRDKNEQQINYR
jgi:hypothetical protein